MKFSNLDAQQSIFFLRELEKVKAKVLERLFPQFKWLLYIPISTEAGPGAESITQTMYSPVGMAKIIANNATDLPRVDVMGEQVTVPVRMVADAYGYSRKEIQSAAMTNPPKPLPMMKANAARRAIEQTLNSIAFQGDTAAKIYGIMSFPNFTKTEAPNGAWTMDSDPDDIIEDCHSLITTPRVNSKGVFEVTHVLLPIDKMTIIQTLRLGDVNSDTILTFLKKVYSNIVWDDVPELTAVTPNPRTGSGTPTNCAVAFAQDPDYMTFELCEDFTQLAPQEKGLEIEIPCVAQTGGVMSMQPLSVNIMDGL